MRLVIDFETRSAIDIKKQGAWVYSEDPSTEVLCLAVKMEGCVPWIWKRGENAAPIIDRIMKADEILAHNMSFEVAIWQNVCVKKYGWPPLPMEKLRCSMAQTCMHALPRSLGEAARALGIEEQKDFTGYRVMLKVCRPRKPLKNETGTESFLEEDPDKLYWHEDPADLNLLYKYCMQDTNSEEMLSRSLSPLPAKELEIWRLDQKINARGIQIDIPSAKNMIAMVAEHEDRLLKRLAILTNGKVKTAKQVEALGDYLRTIGCDLPDLTAAMVAEGLKWDHISPEAREILEIRQSLGRSSSAKYQAMLDRASSDGRVRGSMIYHGASTGRWVGSGIQPHNFPSRIKVSDSPEAMLGVINQGGLELFEAIYDDDPMSVAGAITRSVITAAEGKELSAADFSAIEGRGLAWLAGEESELENYRSAKDVYISTAAMILHKGYDAVTKEERNKIGKVASLACGYGGSVGAVRKFGGDDLDDDEIKAQIVTPWREAHPRTVTFWYDLERACMSAVREPGKIFSARSIGFRVNGKFLQCRLPSGRLLYYYDPEIQPMLTWWGEMKDSVTYMTVDGMTKKWVRTNTYGGKMAENVTQSICRDIMAEAMLRLEAAGYPIVMTVHDEIVSEVPEGFGSVDEFEKIMCEVPKWATGFPISAEGWRGKRYRK